jgi:hypothetical protein
MLLIVAEDDVTTLEPPSLIIRAPSAGWAACLAYVHQLLVAPEKEIDSILEKYLLPSSTRFHLQRSMNRPRIERVPRTVGCDLISYA